MPVGQHLREDRPQESTPAEGDNGSIIIVVATDAPLLPHQLKRIAKRARHGARAPRLLRRQRLGRHLRRVLDGEREGAWKARVLHGAEFIDNGCLDVLFEATVQATEEAIVNSMVAARDMDGNGGSSAKALPQMRSSSC